MCRRCVAVLLVCLGGCRDLTIPAVQTGSVSGLVVYTGADGLVKPAAGAAVMVSGTSLRATATAEGAFSLQPITTTAGQLLLSLDLDGDGAADLTRAVDFEAYGIGPNHQAALGTLSLRSAATLQGTVLLAGASATGNAGTTVFVPGLPLATLTSDTGAFVLGGVPEGTSALAAAHAGYATARLSGLQPTAGALLSLAPLTLQPGAAELATLTGEVAAPGHAGHRGVVLRRRGDRPGRDVRRRQRGRQHTCTTTCTLVGQFAASTCAAVIPLKLERTGPAKYGAVFYPAAPVLLDPKVAPSCTPAAVHTNVLEFVLTAPGKATIVVPRSSGPTGLELSAGACGQRTVLDHACTADGGLMLESGLLDAGLYTVSIGTGENALFNDARLSV